MICAGYLLGVTDMGILPDADFQAAVTGEVVSVRRLTYYQRVIVQSPELKAKLAVHLPLDVDLAPGLWLSVCGRVTKPDSARNPGEFDYRIYLRGQGVYAFVEVDEFTVLEKKNRARLFLNSLREYVKNNYRENMRSPQLLTAIVLGDRSELSAQQLAWWEQLGIAIYYLYRECISAYLQYLSGQYCVLCRVPRPLKQCCSRCCCLFMCR